MPSEIESALYGDWADRVSSDGDVGDHCLLEFSISRDIASDSDSLRLAVAPNDREYIDRVVATFRNTHVGRMQQPDLSWKDSVKARAQIYSILDGHAILELWNSTPIMFTCSPTRTW